MAGSYTMVVSSYTMVTPMPGGVKEANYFIAFEITLMERAMIQASYIMLTCVISLLLTLVLGAASDLCNNNDTTLVV